MKIPSVISRRARQLCSESDEHHARVWFCMTCKALEQRLMPVTDVLAGMLDDADLTISCTYAPPQGERRKTQTETDHSDGMK